MTEEKARSISEWIYRPPYDVYNLGGSTEAIAEMLDGSYRYALDSGGFLFGFYCRGKSAMVPTLKKEAYSDTGCLDIGLGINPDFTGKKRGQEFTAEIIEDIKQDTAVKKIRLSVAAFNIRAIKCYEKSGFIRKDRFYNLRNMEFITMIKQL